MSACVDAVSGPASGRSHDNGRSPVARDIRQMTWMAQWSRLGWRQPGDNPVGKGGFMIILGIILLILGLIFGIYILWIIGVVLIVLGAIFWILGATGRAVGGRKYWY
jgi:hypothetical protein